jgi:hypothetical protein
MLPFETICSIITMNQHGMETSGHQEKQSEAHAFTNEVMNNDSAQQASITFLSTCLQHSFSRAILIKFEVE